LPGETQKPQRTEAQGAGVPQFLPARSLAALYCLHVMGRRMVDCPRCIGWMVEYAVMVDAFSAETTGETVRVRPHKARGE